MMGAVGAIAALDVSAVWLMLQRVTCIRPFITFDETGHDKTAGLAVLSCFFLVVPFVGG
jgi:hypothetical protein